jgi:hypothetical protein
MLSKSLKLANTAGKNLKESNGKMLKYDEIYKLQGPRWFNELGN